MNLYLRMVDIALRAACVATISYMAAIYLGLFAIQTPDKLGGLWCAISAIMALKQGTQESYMAGWHRILGTLIGTVITAFVIYFIGGRQISRLITFRQAFCIFG